MGSSGGWVNYPEGDRIAESGRDFALESSIGQRVVNRPHFPSRRFVNRGLHQFRG